jgi:hypothetical protein
MKIEAVGCEIITREDGKKSVHKPGEQFETDDKEAQRLIDMGAAKKSADTVKRETKEEKAAREAAEKAAQEAAEKAQTREGLEAKALELKIGAPEEIKALSDKDLKDGIAKAGDEGKSFLAKLFGGAK